MNVPGSTLQSPSQRAIYIGRFAPSPTGPLHFGSLVAAVGSYLQARSLGGRWLVRMEDIDQPRVKPGADDLIIRCLNDFGFEWDGPIAYQSRHLNDYQGALSLLRSRGAIFPCTCSRAQIAQGEEQRYPGTCRTNPSRPGQPIAQRFLVDTDDVFFEDLLQGPIKQNIADASGDFVVHRRDGFFAYHLAVVVDDARQGITEVVRGGDLLDSTGRHILLQRALGVASPRYCHLPLAVDSFGSKLSKSAQSLAVDAGQAPQVLWEVLTFLRQAPSRELRDAGLSELWKWAVEHWNLEPLRLVKSDQAPSP